MSKIPPMQAEALGLAKKTDVKPSTKPAAKPVAKAEMPTVTKTVAPIVTAKPATKPAVKKPVPAKTATAEKKAKPQKIKMERDSFTMPKEEYAKIAVLKARLLTLGQPVKKSELLRAGVMLLEAMSDNTLKATLAKVPVIKTGRPKKK